MTTKSVFLLMQAEWERVLNRMAEEGRLVQKGSPEDRAKHQQEVMDSMEEARFRANKAKMEVK